MKIKVKFAIGITAGCLGGLVLSILLVNRVPFLFSEYFPVLIGSFLSYFIVREKPVLVGAAVGSIMLVFSVASLIATIQAIAPLSMVSTFNIATITAWAFYIPAGMLGTYFANFVKSKSANESI